MHVCICTNFDLVVILILLVLVLSVLIFENPPKTVKKSLQVPQYFTFDVSDCIDMQTSCIPSELERKQSVVHEDVAVSQEVKHFSTCEQKVTFCDQELPNIAAGQDRYNRFFCIVNFDFLNPSI